MTSAVRITVAFICAGLTAAGAAGHARSSDLWGTADRGVHPGSDARRSDTYGSDLYRPMPWTAWQGLYLGGSLGHGSGSVGNGAGIPSIDARGQSGALHGGYNRQIGHLVLGLEGDYGWFGADGRSQSGSAVHEADFGGHGSIRLRLGGAIDKLHIYGTIGHGWSSVTLATGDETGRTTRSDVSSGLVYGGGLELKIAPQLSFRTELLRYDLAQHRHRTDGARIGLDTPLTELRAGITWHLGQPR